jgi:hypothetical protein
MVLTINIDRWDVSRILIDNGSQTEVLSYVDDIVVASKKKALYIFDLMKTFANMHEAKLKLNPEKCVFGVTWGKVLGCLVPTKGIEASPDKIKATLQM